MAMKGYLTFPKAPTIWLFNVIYQDIRCGGEILPLSRDAVGVFYSLSWLGHIFQINGPGSNGNEGVLNIPQSSNNLIV